MLQCRECGQLLIRTRDLAVSVCPKCRLRVLPVAALEATLTPDAARAFRERVALDDGQPGASCPSCRGTMRALDVAFDGLVVELDVCRHCQLVLLDPGEIDQLPRRPPPPPMDAAVAKREMAKARVEIERQRPRWLYSDDYELTWQQWIPALLRLPVDVDAPFTATPRATWGVAAALVVAFLIELTNQREFITQLGWIPAHPFRWLGLISLTSFFVHAGWLHLLGNLYFLLAFGPGVESRLGVRRSCSCSRSRRSSATSRTRSSSRARSCPRSERAEASAR